MKITLVSPPSLNSVYGRIQKYIPPTAPSLGLLYIAAVLEKNNIPVNILDGYANNYSIEECIVELKRHKPDLIGITTITPMFGTVVQLAREIKKHLAGAIVVAGGPHVTAIPEATLKNFECFDIIVVGEGEYTFLDVAQGKTLEDIKGIVYRKNGSIHTNPPRNMIENLDELPFPARHLIDLSKYSHALFECYGKPMTTTITSRGCPYQCTFCASQLTFGRKVRYRSPENVMEEVDLLINKYGIKSIELRDDTFTGNPYHATKLAKEMKKRRIPWVANANVNNITDNLTKELKEGGCVLLMVGVESGDDDILKELKKGITVKKITTAFEIMHKYSMETLAFFIFGSPSETKETARKTINLAKRINPTFVEFFILNPFPGSEAYHLAVEKGLIKDINWAEVASPQFFKPIINHPNFRSEELQKLLNNAYREFYFRFSYIVSTVLRMNSWLKVKYYFNLLPAILKLSGY